MSKDASTTCGHRHCEDLKLDRCIQIINAEKISTKRKETLCLGDLTCEVKLSYYCETHESNHFIDLDKDDK